MKQTLKLQHPWPETIKDPTELKSFVKKFPVVPAYGTTAKSSHIVIKLLWELFNFTPSFATCISDIAGFAFEAPLDIILRPRAGLIADKDDESVVPHSTKDEFAASLESVGISLEDVIDLTLQLYDSYNVTGTTYLRYKEVTVGGTKQLFMSRIHELNVMFLYDPVGDNPPNERSILVMSQFTEENVTKGKFEILRTFPFMSVEGNGDRETVFCLKNKTDDSDFYGRSDKQHIWFWEFIEHLFSSLEMKVGSTEFVSKLVFFFQQPDLFSDLGGSDDLDEDMKEKIEMLRRILTNVGGYKDVEGIGVMSYPHGTQAPTVEKLDINRDTDHLVATLKLASDYIYGACRWSKELSGAVQSKGGIGADILKTLFRIKQLGVVSQDQNRFERFWRMPLIMAHEYAGNSEMQLYGIKYQDRIEELIEKLTLAGGETQKQEVEEDLEEATTE